MRKIFFLLMFLLMISNISAVIEGVKDGISVSVRSVIPSLFPFIVISDIISKSDILDIIPSALRRILTRLFKISGAGVLPFFLGALCGFPTGAKSAITLFELGKLHKEETERLLAFANNTGAAFVIGGVGAAMFGNIPLGIAIYFLQIISALIVGYLLSLSIKNSNITDENDKKTKISKKPPPLSQLLSDAVSSGTAAMTVVCGYVIFFSAVSKVSISLLSNFNENTHIFAFIYAFFEIGSGTAAAAAHAGKNFYFAAVMAAFCVGWGGLSVHFQTVSFAAPHNLSLKKYFYGKALCAIICTSLTLIFLKVFPMQALSSHTAKEVFAPSVGISFAHFVRLGYLLSLLSLIKKITTKKRKTKINILHH